MGPNKKEFDKRTRAVLKNLQKFLKLLDQESAPIEGQKKNKKHLQLSWENWMISDSMNLSLNTLCREFHLN